jgi:uncharacterized protein (DUF2141 family)
MRFLIIIMSCWFGFVAFAEESEPLGNLTLQVSNVASNEGAILVALYRYDSGKDSLWQAQPHLLVAINNLNSGVMAEYTFAQLPYADYAVKLFQDENNNQLLDVSESGLPLEPFALSQAKGQKKRVLKLKDAIIRFDKPSQNIELSLIKLKNH